MRQLLSVYLDRSLGVPRTFSEKFQWKSEQNKLADRQKCERPGVCLPVCARRLLRALGAAGLELARQARPAGLTLAAALVAATAAAGRPRLACNQARLSLCSLDRLRGRGGLVLGVARERVGDGRKLGDLC